MTTRTVGAVVLEQAQSRPGHTFMICDDERLTYGDLDSRTADVARRFLHLGVGHGTHVGLLLPNGLRFALAAVAALRLGAVVVPLSTLSTPAELHTLITGADVRILITVQEFRGRRFDRMLEHLAGPGYGDGWDVVSAAVPGLRKVVVLGSRPLWPDARITPAVRAAAEAAVRAADPAVIVHTSGSTGAPKGAVHAHGPLLDHLRVLNDLRDYRRDDVLFSNSPWFWIGGLAYTFLGTLLAGATVLCSRSPDPATVLDLLERERPTMGNGYPTAAAALAADPSFTGRDLSSLRRGNLYALMPKDAAPADPRMRTAMLGMTEGGSVVLSGSDEADLPEHLWGSFGRPTPDLEARIDGACGTGDVGELWLRGPAMMLGYYGRERSEAFDQDGWFHTGDLVHRDEHDHWYFHGRADDMIKTAGANVSPAEVQDAVRAATGIESIAVGLPDPVRGQVVAVLLVTDGPVPPDLPALLAPHLSSYKIPRTVRAVQREDVPLKPGGKVDIARVRTLFD